MDRSIPAEPVPGRIPIGDNVAKIIKPSTHQAAKIISLRDIEIEYCPPRLTSSPAGIGGHLNGNLSAGVAVALVLPSARGSRLLLKVELEFMPS